MATKESTEIARLNKQVAALNAQLKKIKATLATTSAAARSAGSAAKRATNTGLTAADRSLVALSGSLGLTGRLLTPFNVGLGIAAGAALRTATAVIRTSDSLVLMRNQLRLVSSDVDRTFAQLTSLAQATRQELDTTVRLYVRTRQALRDIDPSLQEDRILDFVRAVQQATIISGACLLYTSPSPRD